MTRKTTAVVATLLAPAALLWGCTTEVEEPGTGSTSAAVTLPLGSVACPMNLGSCKANDVVTTVISAQEIGGDDCADGFLDVEFTVEFDTTANERYDIGFFASEDGEEIDTSTSCVGIAPQVGDGEPNRYPDLDNDTFPDLDPHSGADTCGDLSASVGPVQVDLSGTFACTAENVTDTGELTVRSCRVWQQNANHPGTCTNLSEAGTGSKCDCDALVLQVDPCSLIVCDDGLFCNGTETCDSSTGVAVCQPGTPPNCDDGVACTDDSCNEVTDMCDNLANNANCDDGLFCNGTETCDPTGGCQAGTPPSCASDGYSCTTESCNETTDQCESNDNGLCQTLPPTGSGCSCTCLDF